MAHLDRVLPRATNAGGRSLAKRWHDGRPLGEDGL